MRNALELEHEWAVSAHANRDAGDEHEKLQEEREHGEEDDLEHGHRGPARIESHGRNV